MAIFDSDVLIHFFRRHPGAIQIIESEPDRAISDVTYMEVMQGARDRKEIEIIRFFLSEFGFQRMALTENISHRASLYIEEFALNSGLQLPDALIAATAMEKSLPLVTGNVKHFKVIPGLQVKAFRPRVLRHHNPRSSQAANRNARSSDTAAMSHLRPPALGRAKPSRSNPSS